MLSCKNLKRPECEKYLPKNKDWEDCMLKVNKPSGTRVVSAKEDQESPDLGVWIKATLTPHVTAVTPSCTDYHCSPEDTWCFMVRGAELSQLSDWRFSIVFFSERRREVSWLFNLILLNKTSGFSWWSSLVRLYTWRKWFCVQNEENWAEYWALGTPQERDVWPSTNTVWVLSVRYDWPILARV